MPWKPPAYGGQGEPSRATTASEQGVAECMVADAGVRRCASSLDTARELDPEARW